MMHLKQLATHRLGARAGGLRTSDRTMPGPRRRRRPPDRSSPPTGPAIQPLAPVQDNWWRLYDDPVLDGLIADALAHNTDVRAAVARLARARAALREVKVDRLPQGRRQRSAQPAAAITGQSGRSDQLRCRARRRL